MRAKHAYELLVTRDTVEIVEVASGEVVLFWDTPPEVTGRLARAIRHDLIQLGAEEFIATWRRYRPAWE